MKIGTFNVRNLFDVGSPNNVKDGILTDNIALETYINNISNVIAMCKPNILVAQEVGSEILFTKIAEKQNSNCKTFIAKPDVRGIANAVMYNVSAEVTTVSDMTSFPVFVENEEDVIGKNFQTYREFVHVIANYADAPLHIIGVHFKAYYGIPMKSVSGEKLPIVTQRDAGDALIRSSIFRFAQARRLREYVDELFQKDANSQIIVLGDFNVTMMHEVLGVVKGSGGVLATKLFNTSVLIPKEKRFSHVRSEEKILVDHILISQNLINKVEKIEIFNEFLEKEKKPTNQIIYNSDHAPLVVTLKNELQ